MSSYICWADDSEFELATWVVQKAADYNSRLHDLLSSLPPDDRKVVGGLEAEYFILRAALASVPGSSSEYERPPM